MQKIIFVGLLSFLILSGVVLAQQSGEQEKGSSMRDMMEQMMEGKAGDRGMGGMEGMMGMMRMMGDMSKMMDKCSAMMQFAQAETRDKKEGQSK